MHFPRILLFRRFSDLVEEITEKGEFRYLFSFIHKDVLPTRSRLNNWADCSILANGGDRKSFGLSFADILTLKESRHELIHSKFTPEKKVYSTSLLGEPQQFRKANFISEEDLERSLQFFKGADAPLVKTRKPQSIRATRDEGQTLRLAQKPNEGKKLCVLSYH